MEEGCWLFAGSLSSYGYGVVFHEGKQLRAHRIMYEAIKGPIPAGKHIDHLFQNWISLGRKINSKENNMDETVNQRAQSFGEKAVGITFNPSDNMQVNEFKRGFAEVIDRANALREQAADPEVKRMLSVAITEAQTAQMWAVKAVTWSN